MLKDNFLEEVRGKESQIKALVVAIKRPWGSVEIITNTDDIQRAISYYDDAYDDLLRLKRYTDVQIVNYMVVV